MAQSMADFDIPRRVINQILKLALPKNVKLTEEAKKAIGRSAAIYLLCVSSTAQSTYKTNDLNANIIIETVVNLGFDQFRQPLEQFLQDYHKKHSLKQRNPRVKKRSEKEFEVDPKESAVNRDCCDHIRLIVNQIQNKTDIKTELNDIQKGYNDWIDRTIN